MPVIQKRASEAKPTTYAHMIQRLLRAVAETPAQVLKPPGELRLRAGYTYKYRYRQLLSNVGSHEIGWSLVYVLILCKDQISFTHINRLADHI